MAKETPVLVLQRPLLVEPPRSSTWHQDRPDRSCVSKEGDGQGVRRRRRGEAIKPSIIYPSVRNPHNQIDRDLLKAVESTRSYRLLDIDELTGKRDQQLQECCWPELVYDANRNPIGLK